jgi:SAM-dependent methyltransferase
MIIRVGAPHDAGEAALHRYFERSGAERKRAILDLLPEGYSLDGRRVLDFGCGSGRVLRHLLAEAEAAEVWGCDPHAPSVEWVERNLSPPIRTYLTEDPPLPHPDGYFDVVYAISVFTHITDAWSEWLLELHRVLKPEGLLIATFLGPATWDELAPRPIDEERLGIAFLELHQELDATSGPNVLHSRWWLREHWGRAFDILTLKPDGFVRPGEGHGVVVGRKRDVSLSREELEAPADDPRELEAERLRADLAPEGGSSREGDADASDRSRPAGALSSRYRRLRRAVGRRREPAAGPWLEPILVDYAGRDGSTLMMRLLATSSEIAVEPPYPYEKKYFAYLLRWARLLDRPDWPGDVWSPGDLGSIVQEKRGAMLGPPPWSGRLSFEPGNGERSMADACFDHAWREFSRRAIASTGALHPSADPEARYYAEKHLQTWKLDPATMPHFRKLILLRDPRDVYLSVLAFNEKRPDSPPIGQRPDEARQTWRRRFMRTQRERLRWVASCLADDDGTVVRYEDLIGDLAGEARRLEGILGVSLDADAVAADAQLWEVHSTSGSPEASIGRWRTEMKAREVRAFERQLGDELRGVGLEA